MKSFNNDTGYYVEPVVDEARRHRTLMWIIAAGALAAVATMVLSFMR
jgi:hypothetical protein